MRKEEFDQAMERLGRSQGGRVRTGTSVWGAMRGRGSGRPRGRCGRWELGEGHGRGSIRTRDDRRWSELQDVLGVSGEIAGGDGVGEGHAQSWSGSWRWRISRGRMVRWF